MTPYEGNKPYIFISYAHKDSERVLPILDAMAEKGFRIWYDAGIEAGTEWPDYIATHLENATSVLAFLSPASIASSNCRQEINYAMDLEKTMLTVYLDEMTLTGGMRMRLGLVQAMFYYRHKALDSFVTELARSELLSACKEVKAPQEEIKTIKQKLTPPAPTPAQTPTPAPTPTTEPLTLKNDTFTIEKGELVAYTGSRAEETVPSGVIVIGSEVFKCREHLKRVILPDSVTLIRSWAFADCTALSEIKLPKGIDLITSQCFLASGLTSITIPEGVTAIGRMAFKECLSLTEVKLPETLEEIAPEAFRGCASLAEITIPKSVKIVGDHAFTGCSKLKRVYISSGTHYVTEGKRSFPPSAKIFLDGTAPHAKVQTTVAIPSKPKKAETVEEKHKFDIVSGVLMRYSGIGGKVVLNPYAQHEIGKCAFLNNQTITSINIPARVKKIGNSAFDGCKKLESVTFNEGLEEIGDWAFKGCERLTELKIPKGVKKIGALAFYGNKALSSVVIPETVAVVGDKAFDGCPALCEVYVSRKAKCYRALKKMLPNTVKLMKL